MFFKEIRPNFMDAVRRNDIDAMRSSSIAGLTLQDFETAYRLLDDHNPDWRTRPTTDFTRAIITGVANQIKAMKAPDSTNSNSP